jgi:flagellar protein FlaG
MDELKIGNSPPAQQRAVRASSQTGTDVSVGHRVGRSDGAATISSDSKDAARIDEARQAQQVEGAQSGLSQVKEAVERLNDYVQSVQRDLHFDYDEDAGRAVIRVIDQSTSKVIRQIPDELALELARNLNQNESLSLLNIKV